MTSTPHTEWGEMQLSWRAMSLSATTFLAGLPVALVFCLTMLLDLVMLILAPDESLSAVWDWCAQAVLPPDLRQPTVGLPVLLLDGLPHRVMRPVGGSPTSS